MKGIAYGVGVGPGDPELMTLKAIRLIRENDVIAVPGKEAENSAAYKIAAENVPDIAKKEILPVYMQMIKDRELLHKQHIKCAKLIEKYLDAGRNVVYITLGDPSVYSTFTYLQHILENDGYETRLVSGVTSFCAAAARLNIPLAEWDEPIHILPFVHQKDGKIDKNGTYVLMKTGRSMAEAKRFLKDSGRSAMAVENCGMHGEKVYFDIDDIPDETGYFSLMISK